MYDSSTIALPLATPMETPMDVQEYAIQDSSRQDDAADNTESMDASASEGTEDDNVMDDDENFQEEGGDMDLEL